MDGIKEKEATSHAAMPVSLNLLHWNPNSGERKQQRGAKKRKKRKGGGKLSTRAISADGKLSRTVSNATLADATLVF